MSNIVVWTLGFVWLSCEYPDVRLNTGQAAFVVISAILALGLDLKKLFSVEHP